jgi:glycosyltransferase involved in cell wall biosynthesis
MQKLLILSTVTRTMTMFLIPYARYFKSIGWHVAGGARKLSEDSELVNEFDEVFDVPWNRKALAIENFTQAAPFIRDLVLREGFDIVHVHSPIAAFLTRFALRHTKTPVVYTAHGFHFGYSGASASWSPYFYMEKIAAKWTDTLVVINRDDYNLAKEEFLSDDRLVYMPGVGVDLDFYNRGAVSEEDILRVRAELTNSSDDFLLLMMAEFNPGKRHRDLFKAFSLVDRPNLHLALAGDGRLLDTLKKEVSMIKNGKNIHFLGFRRDVPTLLAAADATILPSEREGLPRSLMESMALGTLAMGTRTRGVQDLLDRGAGYLFDVGNVSQIADCIRKAMNDPQDRAHLVYNAQQRVKAYDLKNILREHERLYTRLSLLHSTRTIPVMQRDSSPP